MTARRLMIVSGSSFEADPWRSHTAPLWFEIAREFDSVHIFARSTRQQWVHSKSGKVHLHLIPRGPRRMATFFLSSWLLPFVMLRVRPTHIIAQSAVYGGVAAVVFGRAFHVPVMLEIHGEHYVRPGQVGERAHRLFFRPVARWSTKYATLIRSLAPEMTDEISRVLGERAAQKSVEIPNRVSLEVFSPRKSDYSSSGALRIAYVGTLNRNKNQTQLIRHLERIGIPCDLNLVGDGPEAGAVGRLAETLDVVKVHMYGRLTQQEVFDVLSNCDVYVHYSKSEAVSRAVLEAMAVGLPVIVGPAGFLGGIVDDGDTGLRLRRLDVGLLEDALVALQDEATRRRLGMSARHRVEENHEWATVFSRLQAALRSMD